MEKNPLGGEQPIIVHIVLNGDDPSRAIVVYGSLFVPRVGETITLYSTKKEPSQDYRVVGVNWLIRTGNFDDINTEHAACHHATVYIEPLNFSS